MARNRKPPTIASGNVTRRAVKTPRTGDAGQGDGLARNVAAGAVAASSGPITGSAFTMTTARVLGRGTAGTGAVEELSLGSGLSLVAGVLDAVGGSGSGTVTSVALSVPTGLSVSGSPITTSGTLALTFASGYSIPLTADTAKGVSAYGWGNHASAGYLTAVPNSGVTAGSYTNANITVGADGRLTAASNGSGGGGGSFRGALVNKTANQTGANYSAGVIIAWNNEVYDTDSIHDNVTNNSRLTVPSGVTYIKVKTHVYVDALSGPAYLQFFKNGSASFAGNVVDYRTTNTENTLQLESPVLSVTAGDYFEVKLTTPSDSSITVYSSGTLNSWFAMEIVA